MTSPLVIDFQGFELTAQDRELLSHPLVGGVILFARNYHDKAQLRALTQSIKQLKRSSPLFIAVDQEGGRVQRFQSEFTCLPSAKKIGEVYQYAIDDACTYAKAVGYCMAAELIECGVDLSFAPVLDVNHNLSEVIGSRSFHEDPEVVGILAKNYMQGMTQAGMSAVGKHFPGHGAVKADSHLELPIDARDQETIKTNDLIVFEQLIKQHALPAVMTAHIIFPEFDKLPVTFSSYWLKTVLREQLSYQGLIFSDDLTMAGAVHFYPDILTRVSKALSAGCDYILICNDQSAAAETLDNFSDVKAMTKTLKPVNNNQIDKHQLTAAQALIQKYQETCYD